MVLPSRAGLALFFLFLCFSFSSSLPITHNLPKLIPRNARGTTYPYPAALKYPSQQQDDIYEQKIMKIKHNVIENFHEDDPPVLVRRKSKDPSPPKAATPKAATPKTAPPAKAATKAAAAPASQKANQPDPPKVHKSLGERMHVSIQFNDDIRIMLTNVYRIYM